MTTKAAKRLEVTAHNAVRIVDAEGQVRMRGERPLTVDEFIRGLLNDPHHPDARLLRWRPYGSLL